MSSHQETKAFVAMMRLSKSFTNNEIPKYFKERSSFWLLWECFKVKKKKKEREEVVVEKLKLEKDNNILRNENMCLLN